MRVSRRAFMGAGATAMLGWPMLPRAASGPDIVIVGAGFGGMTIAKYLRRFNPGLRITLIEPHSEFLICPLSMRVIRGSLALSDITRPYASFMSRYGVNWIQGYADDIDPASKQVFVGKERISYDRLILSPGVEFNYANIPDLQSEVVQANVPHAWRAGPQTVQLRNMLLNMRSGGVFAMHVPSGPIRAKPAVYERASLVADMLLLRDPRAKILMFDSAAEPAFGKGIVRSEWKSRYGDMIEYVPNAEIQSVAPNGKGISLKGQGSHKVDVLNIIPPQRAGVIAQKAGLANVDRQWCEVDFLTLESTQHKGIHVLGDSMAGVAGMPKSAQMANQEAKVCAAAISSILRGQPVNPEPLMISAGYTFISPTHALAASAVYRYDVAKKTMAAVKGAGGSSAEPTLEQGLFAMSWAENIMNDVMA